MTAQLVKSSPREYRQRLLVDVNGAPKPLISVQDDWQRADAEALEPGLQVVVGAEPTHGPVKLRAYLERPRGHSKTTDIAVMVSWIIYSASRLVRGVVAAGDSDQARLVLDAINLLCKLNPALGSVLEVQRNVVRNKETGSELAVISSDAATSWGLLVDFVIIDELTHWSDGNGETLFHSLISTVAKRKNCLLLIISNAGLGMGSSWQWAAREAARTDSNWYFSRLDGPRASWITPEMLAEQQRFLPNAVYRRVWLNEWLSEAGDALRADDIEAASKGELAQRMEGDERGYFFVSGVDYGIKHDRAATVTVAVNPEQGIIRLADCQALAPSPGGKIDGRDFELMIRDVHWRFRPVAVVYDFWQMDYMAERLKQRGVSMQELKSGPSTLNAIATTLVSVFTNRVIKMYRDEALIRDLLKLMIVPRNFGVKLEAPRDADGHADRAFAFAYAVNVAYSGLFDDEPPRPEFESILSSYDI